MRFAWRSVGLAFGTSWAVLGACSSQTAPPEVDAGNGSNQTIGAACNPSLSNACEQPSDVCSIAVCDPTTRVCTRVAVDAGPICSNGNPPVCSSDDCDAAVEAGDASDATVDASDASLLDGATDSTTDGAAGDASTDAPTDAGDSGGD